MKNCDIGTVLKFSKFFSQMFFLKQEKEKNSSNKLFCIEQSHYCTNLTMKYIEKNIVSMGSSGFVF